MNVTDGKGSRGLESIGAARTRMEWSSSAGRVRKWKNGVQLMGLDRSGWSGSINNAMDLIGVVGTGSAWQEWNGFNLLP